MRLSYNETQHGGQNGLPESDVRTALPEIQHSDSPVDETQAMEQYATLEAIIHSALLGAGQPYTAEPESMDLGLDGGPSFSPEDLVEGLMSDGSRDGTYDQSSKLKSNICALGCGRSFSRKQDCLRHERAVHGPPQFVCKICTRAFTRKDHYHSHVAKHGKQPQMTDAGPSVVQQIDPALTEPEVAAPPTIPKPAGHARRDYKIFEGMGYETQDNLQYKAIIGTVRRLARAHLDMTKTMGTQNSNGIQRVKHEAIKEHPSLVAYENTWPVEDLLSQFLENYRAYARKKTGDSTTSAPSAIPTNSSVETAMEALLTNTRNYAAPLPAPPAPAVPTPALSPAEIVSTWSNMFLTDVEFDKSRPEVFAGSSDVFQGTHRGEAVAAKRIRPPPSEQPNDPGGKALQRLTRELLVWRQLTHARITPLLGLLKDPTFHVPYVISQWMPNGNVMAYLRQTPVHAVNRLQLITEIAEGLRYLHDEKRLVHGNLKASKVLVDADGRVRLTGFGMADLAGNAIPEDATTSVRWMAPELIRLDPAQSAGAPCSTAADVYAFACVVCEIYTMRQPFDEIRQDFAVVLAIMRGQRPSRDADADANGEDVLYGLWEVIQRWWASDPAQRPSMKYIQDELADMA